MAESIAHRIKKNFEKAKTYSIYSNVAIIGRRLVSMPIGVEEMRIVNTDGRPIAARYHYADGSRLHYTWSETDGKQLRAEKGK